MRSDKIKQKSKRNVYLRPPPNIVQNIVGKGRVASLKFPMFPPRRIKTMFSPQRVAEATNYKRIVAKGLATIPFFADFVRKFWKYFQKSSTNGARKTFLSEKTLQMANILFCTTFLIARSTN